MMRSALFSSALDTESKTSLETMSTTSVPLYLDYLDYTLFVYPSNVTKAVYTNNSPAIAFVVVACAFLFTSMVFVSYDCFVARRQRIVMNRAIASSASKCEVAHSPVVWVVARSMSTYLIAIPPTILGCSCVISISCPSTRPGL